MKRPFEIQFDRQIHSETIMVAIEFATNISSNQKKQEIITVMQKFADLGTVGALSGANVEPSRSTLQILQSKLDYVHGIWKFNDAHRIDCKSIYSLLNILHFIHEDINSIANVKILWNEVKLLENPLAQQFPDMYSKVPFEINIDFENLEGNFDICVEFTEIQKLELAEEINNTMGVWFSAINIGTYADDLFSPSDSHIFFTDDVSTVNTQGIEWYIEEFHCNSCSLYGLINLLHKVHDDKVHLKKVNILGW